MGESMEERIKRALKGEAIQEIQNRATEYCIGCDEKDMDLLMSIYAEDAHVVWKDLGWDLHGKAEIRKTYAETLAAYQGTRHKIYNPKIVVEGDRATATHYVDVQAADAEGTTWLSEGSYHREFIKEDGTWRVKYQETFQKSIQIMNPADVVHEIQNVVTDYSDGSDDKDIERVMSTIAEDAHVVWEEAGQDLKGKDEIRKAFEQEMVDWSNSKHKIYNWHIKVEGNTATSTHSVDWHADDREGTTYALEGRYYREFVKEDGAWKIKFQSVKQDFLGPFKARP